MTRSNIRKAFEAWKDRNAGYGLAPHRVMEKVFYAGYRAGQKAAKEQSDMYAEAVAEICSEDIFNKIEAEYNLRREVKDARK